MKKIIIGIFTICLAGFLLILFSYRSGTEIRTTITEYYVGDNQRVQQGVSGQSDPRENSMDEEHIVDEGNWTDNSTPNCPCAGGYFCSMSYQEETTADGGCDGHLTKAEAKAALADYLITNGTIPANGGTITVCNAVITVYRKCAVS